MLPYWYHISEVAGKQDAMAENTNNGAVVIDWLLRTTEGLSSILTTLTSCLY